MGGFLMGRPKANSIHANGLTDRQEMILEFIRSYISENNYPPSVREIGKGVGLAPVPVFITI